MSDRVFWRCSRRECKATAVTVAGRVEHVRTLHSHEPPAADEFFVDNHRRPNGETHRQGQLQTVRFNFSTQVVPGGSRPRARRRSHQLKESVTSIPRIAPSVSSFVAQKRTRFYSGDPNLRASDVSTLPNAHNKCFSLKNDDRQVYQVVAFE